LAARGSRADPISSSSRPNAKREGHRAYWDTDRESYSDVLGFEGLDLAVHED